MINRIKTIAIFAFAILFSTCLLMAVSCETESSFDDVSADYDTLNEWYITDELAENVRIAFRRSGQQPPLEGHFAQACVLLREAGFVEEIERDELSERTRGTEYFTAYNVGIAWLLAGGTSDEQMEWCDKMVALYNFNPWFEKRILWQIG